MSWFIENVPNCPQVIVETGTYFGDGVRDYIKTSYFKQIYSIEISNYHVLRARNLFMSHPNVHILEGDSSVVLETMELPNEPILYYLDAHFSGGPSGGEDVHGGCPTLNEVKILAKRCKPGDVIVIDDIRLLGKVSYSGMENHAVYPVTLFDFSHVTLRGIMEALGELDVEIREFGSPDRLIVTIKGPSKNV
jgi:hypothetical protein